MRPGRIERYIKDYNASKNELEKIMTYAKFSLEAKKEKTR